MNAPYQFAIITESFPPCAGGGIAEWSLGMAENLARNGHTVEVLTRWKLKTVPFNAPAGTYRLTRMRGHDWTHFRFWYSLYYIYRYLRRNRDGIIIATTWELGAPFRILASWVPHASLIVAAHGREITKLKNEKDCQALNRTISRACLVVPVSTYTVEEIRKRLSVNQDHKIFCIPNGVNTSRFHYDDSYQDIAQKYNITPATKVILTLARVVERKGHDTVIRCLPRILKEVPDVRYLIAGPGKEPYCSQLRQLTRELNLEQQVVFTGLIENTDLNKYYSLADVYVMVSRYQESAGDSEGFGITFLEAGACQCPVIGSTAGGIPDAIDDGKSGYLVPPDQEDQLAEKILHLFHNPDQAQAMGQAGRQRVETRFNWEQAAQRLLDLMNNAGK